MLGLRVERLEPLSALGEHVLSSCFHRAVIAFALDEIAGLARRHQILQMTASPTRVGMNVVDGQDEPVLKVSQAIQAAVLAYEMIALEDLHSILARQARGAEQELLDAMDRHVPPS